MSFWGIFRYRRERFLEELAGSIAAECRSAAGERVRVKAEAMSEAEARGYIRARTADLVESQTKVRSAQHRLPPPLRSRIMVLAAERVVAGVLEDIAHGESPLVLRHWAA
jgi:hypothetical protein